MTKIASRGVLYRVDYLHEGEFWSMLVVGLPAFSRPVVSASLHKQCI